MPPQQCYVAVCSRPASSDGLCKPHYRRRIKYGDDADLTSPIRSDRPAPGACLDDECDCTEILARGLCQRCYHRRRRHGTLPPRIHKRNLPDPNEKRCRIEGCERTSFSFDWCWMHYTRWLRHGDPGEAAPRRRTTAPGG